MEFGGKRRQPDVRQLFDMKEVIFDLGWLSTIKENFELYYMYRDLFLSRSDAEKLRVQNLRYDITIIPPLMLGREYVKTAGHYHPAIAGSDTTYPELYEILEGEALYLLQKRDLSDVVVMSATAGDKVLVPPGYGHITINRSNKTLKMSNFVARDFSSLYDPIKEKAGGAYFLTKEGWIRNARCPEAAQLRVRGPLSADKLRELGLSRAHEMYPLLKETGKLKFLTRPQEYLDLFEGAI